MKRFYLFIFMFLLPMIVFGAPRSNVSKDQDKKGADNNVPTYIEAKSAVSDNKRRITEFTGNVVVTRGELKIFCDKMIVETDENNKIKKATAIGNVKVIKGDLTVVSSIAYYYPDEEKAIFEGNPKAIKGKDVVTGHRIIYYLKDERSIVESDKSQERVRVIIAPKREEQGKR